MAESAVAPAQTTNRKMLDFSVIWFGQMVSMFGNALTNFALGVWAYQRTGSVTLFALITLIGTVPSILISPMAGVYVDRWNRRNVLIATDVGAAVLTILLAGLLWADQLMIWHIYGIVALRSVVRAFQLPAYTASTTLMIPKEHLARANGMVQFGGAVAQIVAPLLAGFLILTIQLQGIVLIDFVTFLVAIVSLVLVQIPQPPQSAGQRRSVLQEAKKGWTYITTRAGLLSMLIFFALINFAFGMAQVLFTPLILKFSTTPVLGTIGSLGGLGLLVGSLVLSTTGGPKRRIHGVLGMGIFFGFSLLLAGVQASPVLIGIASFTCMFCIPFINGSSQTIWQLKVPPELQGRVFATRMMFSWSCAPIAFALAGPLSDQVFEPLMANDGALAGSIGAIIGSGPGRGVGLLFVLLGMIAMLTAGGGYLYRPLREVEQDLSDSDAVADKKPGEAPAAPAPAQAAATPEATPAQAAATPEAKDAVASDATQGTPVAVVPAESATGSMPSAETVPAAPAPEAAKNESAVSDSSAPVTAPAAG